MTWNSTLSPVAGASVTYVVEAVYSSTSRKGSEAVQGHRAPSPAPTIVYEPSRDGKVICWGYNGNGQAPRP